MCGSVVSSGCARRYILNICEKIVDFSMVWKIEVFFFVIISYHRNLSYHISLSVSVDTNTKYEGRRGGKNGIYKSNETR